MNPVTVLRRWCNPPAQGMAERNYTAIALSFALVPLAGSLIGVFLVVLVFWAVISLWAGRLEWQPFGRAAPIVLSHAAFFAVLALADLVNSDPATAARDSFLRLFFLIPVLATHRVAISEPRRVFGAVFRGAAIGGCVVPFLALAMMALNGESRAAGLAGNAGPFSILCLLTAGLALLGLSLRSKRNFNILAGLGAAGASLTVVLTGMRGAWPALPIVLGIALWVRRTDIRHGWARLARDQQVTVALVTIGVVLAGAFLGWNVAAYRIEQLAADLRGLLVDANVATSLSLRADMYQAGVEAFFDRPVFGAGEEGIWAAISPYLGGAFSGTYSFSHLHNIVLTVGVQAGMLGIAALLAVLVTPVWCAWRARGEDGGPERLAVASILLTAFLIPGLTNIMFFHDILDAVWALSIWTIAGTLMADPLRAAKADTLP